MKRAVSQSWITSDGQSWESWHEASAHERFITLRARVDYLLRCSLGPDAFAKALLDTEGLHFIVTGPRKGRKEPQ
ncbi:MAG: hypothetical protein LLG08_03880 [Actinomycetia bacterium]|nr:hypothetical protein [Actinomycetes bacterium]